MKYVVIKVDFLVVLDVSNVHLYKLGHHDFMCFQTVFLEIHLLYCLFGLAIICFCLPLWLFVAPVVFK